MYSHILEQELQEMNKPSMNQERSKDPIISEEPIVSEPAPEETHADQEMEKEEPESNPNGPNFRKDFVVLLLSVESLVNEIGKLHITIEPNDDVPNFFVPLGAIKVSFHDKRTQAVAYFHKIHPTKEFGEYTLKVEEILKEEAKHAPSLEVHPGDSAVAGSQTGGDGWQTSADKFEGYQSEISCLACTFFNPVTASSCSMWGTKLPT